MEPPSSVNKEQTLAAGTPVDDPLSKISINESYLVVTSFSDGCQESNYVVCGYSPCTGLSYFGTAGTLWES